MNFFHHKDLGNHLLQLCPKVVKHPVYVCKYLISKFSFFLNIVFFYVTETELVLDGFHGNSDLVTRDPQLLRL